MLRGLSVQWIDLMFHVSLWNYHSKNRSCNQPGSKRKYKIWTFTCCQIVCHHFLFTEGSLKSLIVFNLPGCMENRVFDNLKLPAIPVCDRAKYVRNNFRGIPESTTAKRSQDQNLISLAYRGCKYPSNTLFQQDMKVFFWNFRLTFLWFYKF